MKIKLLILFAVAFGFMACENQENEFDDYGSTSVYFPFQTPARTLILGKYDLGFNDNDNNHRFEIGVTMTGVYDNTKARKVHYRLAPELLDDVANVQALPSNYYTIEEESPVTIPAGSIKGRIPVQLTEDFFNDPLAFADLNTVNYVIPLLITEIENLDTLLQGLPLVDNPSRVNAADWEILPKDYTLYGIKFINKYHGKYLRRGEDKVVGTSEKLTVATGVTETTNIDASTVYKAEFVVQDELTDVITAGSNKAIVTNLVRRAGIPSNSTVSLELTFNDNEEITITNADPDSDIIITGSGKLVEDGDEWGGESRDVIYLEYEYQDLEIVEETVFGQVRSISTLDLMHTVKDTLVIRDRNVVFEEFAIELNE